MVKNAGIPSIDRHIWQITNNLLSTQENVSDACCSRSTSRGSAWFFSSIVDFLKCAKSKLAAKGSHRCDLLNTKGNICGATFPKPRNLRRHQHERIHHPTAEREWCLLLVCMFLTREPCRVGFSCLGCEARFRTAMEFRDHSSSEKCPKRSR